MSKFDAFFSYNHKDEATVKTIIEPLAKKYGKEKIFFDQWSIQPGESILDKMAEGLQNTKNLFFIMSKNSINSEMVKMEWQSILLKQAREHNVNLIPILIDDVDVPILLTRLKYIDIVHGNLRAGIDEISKVIEGINTYEQENSLIPNLSHSIKRYDNKLQFIVNVNHHMEPLSEFILLLPVQHIDTNNISIENEVLFTHIENITNLKIQLSPTLCSYPSTKNIYNKTNSEYFAHCIKISRALTVGNPIKIEITLPKLFSDKIIYYSILHKENSQKKDQYYLDSIPLEEASEGKTIYRLR